MTRNKYTFTKDDNCITLNKVVKIKDPKSKNYGNEVEVLVGYYSNVECLLKKLFHLELISSGTLAELLEDAFKVKAELAEFAKQWRI